VENVCIPKLGQKFLWEPYRGICPSPTTYQGVWNWDAAFHMLAVSRWDPQLAYEQAYLFCNHQNPDGSFVDVILADGTVVADYSKPPVFPWAAEQVHRRTKDDEFLKRVYPHFQKMENFWWEKRGGSDDGLFFYGGANPAFESGWDNSVRWDDYMQEMTRLWPIDLNCYMVMLYRAMHYMAVILGEKVDAELYKIKELALTELVNKRLWDEQNHCYVDMGRDGRPSSVLSPASFMPLYISIAPKEKAERMAALAADEKKFYPGMPTVSYDHPSYESHQFWRGPSWLNTNYFAVKGLKNYGFDEIADAMKEKTLTWCANTSEALREYYDTKTGQGLGASHFGWTSVFVIEYILNY
jgi:neutral trehalase